MKNTELEAIATIVAHRHTSFRTDEECLLEVWKYLVGCGVHPGDFVPQKAEETPPSGPSNQFVVGKHLMTRSLGDWDCVYLFTVVKVTPKFVTLLYHGLTHKVAIRTWSDGVQYCYPFGTFSMAPMVRADSEVTE